MQVSKGEIRLTVAEQVRFEVAPAFQALIRQQAGLVSQEQKRASITVYDADGQVLGRHQRGKWRDA
jgi:hypothetical protein